VYVIKKDRYYVAQPGQAKSYTTSRDQARRFDTKEAAEANKCGNESVAKLEYGWH